MDTKKPEEQKFRAAVDGQAGFESEISATRGRRSPRLTQSTRRALKEQFFHGTNSHLAGFAANIVEYVAEIKKPDGVRLPGFHDSQLDIPALRVAFARADL